MLFYELDSQPGPAAQRQGTQEGGRDGVPLADGANGGGDANRSSNGSTSDVAEGGEEGNKQPVQQMQVEQQQQQQQEEEEEEEEDGRPLASDARAFGTADMEIGTPSAMTGGTMNKGGEGGEGEGQKGNKSADEGASLLTSYSLPEHIHQQLWADNLRSVKLSVTLSCGPRGDGHARRLSCMAF